MKATNSPFSAPFALKLVGYILIVSGLLDDITLIWKVSADAQNKAMLVSGISQLVNQGVIPMIGIALALTGAWLEKLTDIPSKTKIFRVIALSLSALLGVIFLFLGPAYLYNTRQVVEQAKAKITDQAKNAEGQVEQQVQTRQSQLADLVKDQKKFDDQLKQLSDAIASNQVPEAQLPQLKQLQKDLQDIKANPAVLQEKAKTSKEQLLNQIRDQKGKEEKKIDDEVFKENVHVSVNSLILSVGYLIISWVGLSELGSLKGAKRRPAKPPQS
jgi:ABC-type multidrug transport system fused ATPase/permease subunit